MTSHSPIHFGPYDAAVRRWEIILSRPAPDPTEIGKNGGPRLNPVFVEWMMGLPEGWVTGVEGISRTQQLKMLGNGVVPQQAVLAISLILDLPVTPVETGGGLLPTPNPFHLANTETPQEWLERRADVQQRTGTRHGPALPVVAQSISQGTPLIQDGNGPRLVTVNEQH